MNRWREAHELSTTAVLRPCTNPLSFFLNHVSFHALEVILIKATNGYAEVQKFDWIRAQYIYLADLKPINASIDLAKRSRYQSGAFYKKNEEKLTRHCPN